MEYLGIRGVVLRRQRCHETRIYTAAEISADGHIAAQMVFNRIIQKLAQSGLEIGSIVVIVDFVDHIPVTPWGYLSAFHGKCVTREQALDAVKQSRFANRVLKCGVLGEGFRVGFDVGQERHQRLGLGRKHEKIANGGVVERLDTKSIAGAEQPFTIPDRKREHASEVVDAAGSIAGVTS